MAVQNTHRLNYGGCDAFDRPNRHPGFREPYGTSIGLPLTYHKETRPSEDWLRVADNVFAAREIAGAFGAVGQVTRSCHGIDHSGSLCHESATSAALGASQPLAAVAAGLDAFGHFVGFAAEVRRRRDNELARHGDEDRATAAAIGGTFAKSGVALGVGAVGAILFPPAALVFAVAGGLLGGLLTQPLEEDEPETRSDIPGGPYARSWQKEGPRIIVEPLGARSMSPLVEADSFARSHLVGIQPRDFEIHNSPLLNLGSSQRMGCTDYVKP